MVSSNLPLLILAGPAVAAAILFLMPSRACPAGLFGAVHLASAAWVLVLALLILGRVAGGTDLVAFGDWLLVDALGVVFVALIGVIGFLTGFYSLSYVRHDLRQGAMNGRRMKLYYGFFSVFLATMLLAAMSNNIVMMWVAVEATTLGSVFLVGLYGHKSSLEAAWKYVIICTVGVAFGLYGTVLVYANGSDVVGNATGAILWTTLLAHARGLDPVVAKLAFVFVLIGFGTKAGLFPMHAWLPDAHSEAPSPVSALLSGVLLKCALLIIIRYYAIAVRAVGPDFPQLLLTILGGLSIAVAALLFYVQRDLKRKLAYSSIEHVGLMALSLGIGGPLGVGAALLHAINHSFAKSLLFCGSGNVLMKYGTRDLGSVKGLMRVAPVSGLLLLAGILALAGFPPFNIFVSEFMVFTAGVKAGHPLLMVLCALFFTVTVGGLIQIVSGSVLGKAPETMARGDVGWGALVPMVALFALVLALGVAVPRPMSRLIADAASIVLGDQPSVAQGNPPSLALAAPWQSGSVRIQPGAGPSLQTETNP